jgi:hypothetical protein
MPRVAVGGRRGRVADEREMAWLTVWAVERSEVRPRPLCLSLA